MFTGESKTCEDRGDVLPAVADGLPVAPSLCVTRFGWPGHPAVAMVVLSNDPWKDLGRAIIHGYTDLQILGLNMFKYTGLNLRPENTIGILAMVGDTWRRPSAKCERWPWIALLPFTLQKSWLEPSCVVEATPPLAEAMCQGLLNGLFEGHAGVCGASLRGWAVLW